MSGICGVLERAGGDADPRLLRCMTDALKHRGPDGSDLWLGGVVGFGHCMLQTTVESLSERQPVTDETGTCALTFDGRIDNRDELKEQFRLAGTALRTDTDAELVLRAYLAWGDDCALRLLGDFAFAIWNGKRQELYCARDVVPAKPFYYFHDQSLFLFASELHALFCHPAVRKEINEAMAGEYLARAVTHQEETLYRNIYRLPAAHYMIAGRDGIRKVRYWDIDPNYEIRHRTDREYAEQFFELFKTAVRSRMRSHRPLGAYLSGGLDSSSVVGMVQHLARGSEVPDPHLRTFSLVFPDRAAADESAYIQDVIRMWNLPAESQTPPVPAPAEYADQVARYQDLPYYPNGSMSDGIKASAAAKGIRVLLTGLGGDDWLSGSSYHLADLALDLRFFTLLRQAYFDARTASFNHSTHRIIRYGIWPALPDWLRRAIRTMRHDDGAPAWLRQKFAQRINLAQRTREDISRDRFSSFAQADLYRCAFSGFGAHFAEVEERAAAWFGIEQRHPFHDRRIIEFALALPEDQRWRGNEPKFILRNAMRGLLPDSVRRRESKAEFSHVFAEVLQQPECRESLASPAMAREGWLDPTKLLELHDDMVRRFTAGDETYGAHVWTLWLAYGMELWYRQLRHPA